MKMDRVRRALKLALPYGLVRAVQVSREHEALSKRLADIASDLSAFNERLSPIELERIHRIDVERASRAEESARIELEAEAFMRNEVVVGGVRIYARSEAPLIDLQIDGSDNTIVISPPTGPGTLHVATRPGTEGCRFDFGEENRVATNVFVSFFSSGGVCANRSTVRIGKGNLFNGNVHVLAGIRPSTVVTIGDENLFADNIHIVGAVEHLVYDVATMAAESVEHGISIGNQIWVCNDVQINNKSQIASGNVVAAKSFVNRKFEDSNTVIAGIPAKVTKRGVMWHLHTTDAYLTATSPLNIPEQ